MTVQRILPWALRVAWAVLPFTAGPALGDALDPRSRPVQLVASVVLWAVWGAVLAASLVPHPVSLTMVRGAAPAAVAAALAAALDGHGSPLAVSTTALATGFAFLPEIGTLFVNGPAYPNERRFLLRAPAPLLLGMLAVVWVVGLAGPVIGMLLVAARQWVAGGVVLAAGVPVAVVLARAVHGLSRRWLVFVPAGVVLHDPIALADPVLFRRQLIVSLGPADAATPALDLTQTAPGLALELALSEEVPILRAKPGKRLGEAASPSRLLVTPTRPGAVLREAVERGVPVR
ncbi:MAG TPA: hypothetical protein VHM89_01775 [Acidimicrobiales bacterium]|nr:hypothetical protein [Acidimicrobiales bacterium]